MHQDRSTIRSGTDAGVLAVILAAGGGSRWAAAGGAGHKLLALLPTGRPVVEAAIDTARSAGVPVCVVSGAVDLAAHVSSDVALLHNPTWADGQAGSLGVALRWAAAEGFDAVAVGLGDQPFVTGVAWRTVVAELKNPSDPACRPIVVPTFDGRRGQPVGLRREVWSLLPTDGDAGARILMQQAPELVLELRCSGDQRMLIDIDTPGDLPPWN
jgi:molybdenum cofactor cytidylyltransferase